MRRLVYYVAVSIDGFIADTQGSTRGFATDPEYVAALADLFPETLPTPLRRQLQVTDRPRRFDAVLLGRRTHQLSVDAGMSSAYPHLEQHVFTHRSDLPADGCVVVHGGDPERVVAALKRRPGMDIWLCGGGDLAAQIYAHIDELIVKVNPVVLGDGVPLLRGIGRPVHFHLLSTQWFDNGVVLLHYDRVDPGVQVSRIRRL